MSTEQLVVIAFATVQAAMDAAPTGGGTVICPGGSYAQPGTLFWPCDRCVNVTGETPANGRNSQGVTFTFSTTADMARIRGNGSSLRNVTLVGPGGTAASEETGRGITIGRRGVIADPYNNTNPPLPGTNTEVQNGAGGSLDVCRDVVIEDVVVKNAPGWGFFIGGFGKLSDGVTNEGNPVANVTLSIFVTVHRVVVVGPKKFGGLFIGSGSTTVHCHDCQFLACGAENGTASYYGYVANADGTVLDHCTFEGRCPQGNPWLRFGGHAGTIRDCWFEEDTGDTSPHTPQYFINVSTNCDSLGIIRPIMTRHGNTDGKLRLITVEAAGCRGLRIEHVYCHCDVNPLSGGAYIEAPIDLGGNNSWGMTVMGGIVHYTVSDTSLQMRYANIPAESLLFTDRYLKVPASSEANKTDAAVQHDINGFIAMNWDLSGLGGGHSPGALEYYWGGSNAGWRLINNAPRMTRAERDGRTAANWQIGDVIWVTDAPAGRELQVRISGSAWAWLGRTTDIAGD